MRIPPAPFTTPNLTDVYKRQPFANPPNHYSYPKSTAIRYNTINGRIDFCKRRPVMTIQPIGSASVALYITPADLKEHGLTPAGLTLERALAITQTAFHEAGITLDVYKRQRIGR